jgi:hypothetical protein
MYLTDKELNSFSVDRQNAKMLTSAVSGFFVAASSTSMPDPQ